MTEDEIVKRAHKCFEIFDEAESDNRRDMITAFKFVKLREQWPDYAMIGRNTPGRERPMLVVNKLAQFCNQVINEMRMNVPAVHIRPVDDNADIKTAEVLEGIVRNIQDKSNASQAYIHAADCQVTNGIGWFRIRNDYADDGFEQDIFIDKIADFTSVCYDPSFKNIDGSDLRWVLIVDEVPREVIEDEYPEFKGESIKNFEAGNMMSGLSWISKESVRIAEYYWKSYESQEVQDQATGRTRSIRKPVVKWAKIVGNQVVDQTDVPCSYIPVVPVIGNMSFIEGKRYIEGLVANAMDAQRQLNYWKSSAAEMLSLAPKAPFIAPEGSFDGHPEWDHANTVNYSKLEYKPVRLGGQILPKPERQPFAGPPTGLLAAEQQAELDIKSCLGIYDAALSNNPSDQSGKALLTLQRQASQGTYHFSDNLAASIQCCGRILVEMIPRVYDTQRVMRILGEDGNTDHVMIDPALPQSKMDNPGADGIQAIYNPGVGKYDVTATAGPSYATKRQEAAESMMQLVQSYPPTMDKAGDLIVKNMDWPGADVLAKRFKQFLPPQVQQAEQDGQKADPELLRQQMEQMGQQAQQMADQVQHLSEELQKAQEELNAKRANDEAVAMEAKAKAHKAELDVHTALAKIELEQQREEFEEFIRQEQLKLDRERFELEILKTKTDYELKLGQLTMDASVIQNEANEAELAEEAEEIEAQENQEMV